MKGEYLPFLLFTHDNIVISFNSLCNIYNIPYQVNFYNLSYMDRYIYYILLIMLKPLFHILFYTYDDSYIKFIFLLTLTPYIFEYILSTPIITYIKKTVYKYTKKMKQDVVKNILNHICLTVLNHDPHLTRKEVAHIMKKKHKNGIYLFIKNFIILVVVQTVSNGNTYLLRFIKTIYNNNADIKYKNPYPKIHSDIEKIKVILNKRQWDEFCNPYIIHVIGTIYNNQPHTNTYEVILKSLELSFIKVFVGVTIAKLFSIHNYIILGIINAILSCQIHISIMVGSLVGYLCNSYYVTFLVCEYGTWLTPLFVWMYNNIRIKKYIYLLYHKNDYNYYILINMLMCSHCIFALCNANYPLITAWFLLFGYFSNYTLLHMIILGIMLYLFINIYYIKDAPKTKVPIICVTNYSTIVHEKVVPKPLCIVDNYNTSNTSNTLSLNTVSLSTGEMVTTTLPHKLEQPTLKPLKNIIILKTLYNPNYTIFPV